MSFDITNIFLEIVVGDTEEDSQVVAFYHEKSGKKLDFGFDGCWLVDFEGFHCNNVELPKEKGRYRMKAEWNDSSEIIESIWAIEKLDEKEGEHQMKIYHGTNIESAISILTEMNIKARKALPHHENSYVAFTNTLEDALQYGNVVIAIESSNKDSIVPVFENDLEWSGKNLEIIEYTVGMSVAMNEIEEEIKNGKDKSDNYWQLVSTGNLPLQKEEVSVQIVTSSNEEYENLKQLIHESIEREIAIKQVEI